MSLKDTRKQDHEKSVRAFLRNSLWVLYSVDGCDNNNNIRGIFRCRDDDIIMFLYVVDDLKR
jgi:hypothetical protein